MAALIRKDEMRHAPAPLPGWARASDKRVDASDCALFAGAALAALDPIVRSTPAFAGVWRQRLALRAAAATVRMTGRREAEADIRDAWFLRAKGAALGPAGEHLQAWRILASNSTLSLDGLRRAAACFGVSPSVPLTDIFALAMAVTRDFKELVQKRVARDPAFADALLGEGIDTMLSGDVDTGKAILRDYIKATVGFEKLGAATGTPEKSLIRMLGPRGNPQVRNLFNIIGYLQK